VGTSNFFRSSVKSVSEKALMHSYTFFEAGLHALEGTDRLPRVQERLLDDVLRVLTVAQLRSMPSRHSAASTCPASCARSTISSAALIAGLDQLAGAQGFRSTGGPSSF
jgi:hypothetical protein